jgi:hypothetical protein
MAGARHSVGGYGTMRVCMKQSSAFAALLEPRREKREV